MELTATAQQAMDREQQLVHDWRVSQPTRLGIPAPRCVGLGLFVRVLVRSGLYAASGTV
jgi:hypothetical protein